MFFSKSRFISLYIGLLLQVAYVLAQTETTVKETPLKYTPNKTAAMIAGGLYMFTAVAMCFRGQWYCGRYMLAMIIGSTNYGAGLFLRLLVAEDMESVMKYATMNLMILLSPCAFIAGVYMLLGRLAIHLDATEYLLIRPNILTKVFVFSDIFTFLLQAAGGGMMTGDNANMRNIGNKLFLVGLIAQLVSFLVYTLIFGVFVYRLWTLRRDEWNYRPEGILNHWLGLIAAMGLSCQNIIVRSVFRVMESAQGRNGTFATQEQYFYMMDCAVLWVAVSVFVVTWPPKYLTGYNSKSGKAGSHVELMSTSSRV
ncbi:Protoporphyrin uptake protein 1 [Saccharomyces cerevisiae S288c] [Rhizoctonia solani]|uniref:Protoporphyrin uptake protein 1 [Saccharomyces cerevisiae S288c] n=1 Tax=Rhizoctonia solani TaxID=456999 RepID=A0A0K6FTR0_9AGAM|nr:Protoporphyrin uptake protein 1 [Saccharomyces cerevisiae S288c] [Rhizoctonia solani]